MTILFQNTLFLKEFVVWNGCFGIISKIKKGSSVRFWCTFPAWLFHKNVPYLILYQWTNFQCHTLFLSQDIKQNLLLSSYLDSWNIKFWDLSWINLYKIDWQGIKRGKTKIQKLEHLENEKSFLDEIKNIFHSFWRAIIWLKIKIL